MPSLIRILLVDSGEGGAALESLISRMKSRTRSETAANVATGLDRMASEPFDVALVASHLGPESGIEFLRAYRATGGGGAVILIGDEREHSDDIAAMESGAADYLVRDGLDDVQLERSIRYAVAASRRAAELPRVKNELESRVAERTDALEMMNAALAAEVIERRAAERALRAADQGKDEFLATLAHELRNPLAPLSFATEILSRAGGSFEGQEKRERAVGVIERQVAHMVRLIDDLLDLSRVTNGKLELRRERVTLSAVIESALETAGPLLAGRKQAFSVLVPETPVFLHVDPMRLAQILSNLLSNAVKFTEPGGHIRLEAVREGRNVVISVVDSGIGIPPAHLAHVFTMFGQGHRAQKAVFGGLGIGLALSRRLAELHGGTLTGTSEGEGKGSVFSLRVACVPDEAAVQLEAQSSSSVAPSRRRILVVDDNVDAALTLAELLALEGHETHVAHDGPSAVEAARRLVPEVAILDIGLPGFDGLEVARRIRAEPELKEAILVALSGWVQPGDRAQSLSAGFDHHFAKPVQLKSLELVFREGRGGRARTL